MKLIALNGSPRPKWNTAQLLDKVVEGAQAAGMAAKLVHLYDLNFKGCVSCFACKRLEGPSYGRCAMRDDLTPILAEIHEADALVIGTPVYMGGETSGFRAFLERAVFPYFTYTNPPGSLFPRRIPTAVVYTMGAPEEAAKAMGFDYFMNFTRRFLELAYGPCELFKCAGTLQFEDYGKYESSMFDPAVKVKRHQKIFPRDQQLAFELGQRLSTPQSSEM